MTEVKSLNVTADTYRHRGWLWKDRGTYEVFKARMKLPLWVDRILTDNSGENLFVVGKEDGKGNASRVGCFHRGLDRDCIPDTQPERSQYNCNMRPGNGFVVVAERIRAKKPDANKTPRPQWRQPMTKPWEPALLGGEWVVDGKFVRTISSKATPPAWADRLWVSTSANTDTFVWVNSASKGRATGGLFDGELHAATHAGGITGHQTSGGFEPDNVVCNAGCHWQLAGVRKETVWVPEPVVVKPKPGGLMTVHAAQAEQAFYGTDTGRVPQLNPLLAAPYGTDIYAKIAQELGISRGAAKVRLFRDLYTPPKPPIGVKPRNLHDEERANALDEAMVRYLNEDLPFPIEWAVEWNELRARLNKEQK